MSLFDLKSLVGSQEDFADAHEPLNDGIKDVPNAQTVAASVKTGDVGKDTTSQGPAKVVPEKPDTDDETKTEHNVVKESAEKSGGGSAPTASKAPAPKDSGSGDESPAKPAESEKPDEEAEEKSEPLEHQTEKSAKDELEKTEKAKEALEAYAPKAKRFDIIGHPSRQAEQIGKAVGYVQRRSGNKGAVTVSAESIDNAIVLSQTRIAKLEREVRILSKRKVSNEDIADSMGIDNPALVEEIAVTEAPTEHGAPPMDPAAAAALTEAELNPLDVPMLEIQKVQETIGVLEAGAAAVEQYRQIALANPRMSKQAAAFLNSGLEHIDLVCSLKARSTGLETYLTTPRAAMEEAEAISEKSFSDRAGEIGAKILRWIKDLLDKAAGWWNEFSTGLTRLKDRIDDLEKSNFTDKEIHLRPAPDALFIEGDFVGDNLTPDERALPSKIDEHYKKLTQQVTRRISTLLNQAGTENLAEEISNVMQAMRQASGTFAELPGKHYIGSEDGRLTLTEGHPDAPEEFTVTEGEMNPKRILKEMSASIAKLIEIRTPENLNAAGGDISKALIKFRKGAGKDLDEAEFQKVQQAVVDNSIKLFDVTGFFDILRHVGSLYHARYKLCEQLAGGKGTEA